MTNSQKTATPAVPMSVMDAIYHRRAVRDYTQQKIDKETISTLIDAAVHAPTAMHEEAWTFAIVQDKKLLNRLSDSVKKLLTQGSDPIHPPTGSEMHARFAAPEFNAFYNAGTLIIICGKPMGPFPIAGWQPKT
jgi:nitroreductase